jgi:hypothetical protein
MKVTATGPTDPAQPVLVRFRRVNGVDQRLVVFEDGLVEFDERTRTREPTWLTIDTKDLGLLRAALEEVPESRWSRGPALTLCRTRVTLDRLLDHPFSEDLGTSYFQLKRGRRTISGVADEKTDLEVVAFLDTLRWHAFQLAETLQPTR